MFRLIVSVTGDAGLPLKLIPPDKLMSLPLSTNGPAAESKVKLLTVMLFKSFRFDRRAEPAKVSACGKTGTALLSQLPAVLQLLSAPRPVQRPLLMPLVICRLPEPAMKAGMLPAL